MRDYFATTLFVTAITCFSSSAIGGIYKYIDENGRIAYSDKPVVGAKKMKIRQRPAPAEEEEQSQDDMQDPQSGDANEPVTKYDSLELLTPKNDKVVSDRSGAVQVILMPTPRLSNGHELVITVDGKDISRGRHANLNLSQVPRGSHSVSGRILDEDGNVMISSATATFHVRRPTADDELAYK